MTRRAGAWLLAALMVLAAAAGMGARRAYLAGRWAPAFLPPRLDPTRTYHLTYWDYHLPGTAGQQWVTRVLSDFRARYPHITVDYRLLNRVDGETALRAALQDGSFPDVYAGPLAGFLLDSGRVASPDPYLRREEQAAYPPGLWPDRARPAAWWPPRLARRESVGWPRWAVPGLWAADAAALRRAGVDPAAVAEGGWTWSQFLRASEQAGPRFFASDTPLALLRQAMAAQCAPDPFLADGTRTWGKKVAGAGAQMLARLRPRQRSAGGMLEQLLAGRSAVVGQVGLWLQPLARERGRHVVLLPPPHGTGCPPAYRPELNMAFVLSDRGRRDRLPAAMALARFLSQEGAAVPAGQAFAIPLHQPARRAWLQEQGRPPAALVAHYLEHAAAPPLLPAAVAAQERRLLAAAEAAAGRLWRGQAGPEELQAVLAGEAGR